MVRGFSLVEVLVVLAVTGIIAATTVGFATTRMQQNRERELLLGYVAELRAQRLAFVNNGAVALRVVPVAQGAEMRSVTGSCDDEQAGLPTSTLDNLTMTPLPITAGFCVDRYGRATSGAMVPMDVTIGFTTAARPVTWDRTGRIYLDNPQEDQPVRPHLDNLGSVNTRDPTPGTRPVGASQMQPGVLR